MTGICEENTSIIIDSENNRKREKREREINEQENEKKNDVKRRKGLKLVSRKYRKTN